MGITSGTVSIMRSFLAFACLLTLTFGARTGNDRELRRTIVNEGKLYDEIKNIFLLEAILIDIERDDAFDLELVPKINGPDDIKQEAIYKYTTGLSPYGLTPDDKFKKFFLNLAGWQGKPDITLPNTKKKTQHLQALFNSLWNELESADKKLYFKKKPFNYPTELQDDNDRKIFLDALKEDVIFLYAAYLQSYLIGQERNENDIQEETTLYRLQSISRKNLKKVVTGEYLMVPTYVRGETVCTDKFTSTSRPEGGRTFLERMPETWDGQYFMDEKDWNEVSEIKFTIRKPSRSACGVHLPEDGDFASGFRTYQREVLLPIGTCFKIKEIRENKEDLYTKYDIKMECV